MSAAPAGAPTWAVVVPTVGRPSLDVLLHSLAAQPERPAAVVVVDDRDPAGDPAPLDVSAVPGARVLVGGGRGPAHARNVGWRAVAPAEAEWVVLVDDDVVLPDGWSTALVTDLTGLPDDVAGSQALLAVPPPPDRAPTDEERATLGLVGADWITAEMAYRRDALVEVGGMDERFPRAFREDADLALRVQQRGWRLVHGRRLGVHPLRPGRFASSLTRQRGAADDALMRSLHGPRWRERARCPRGRLPAHVAVVVAAATTLVGSLTRRRTAARSGALAWLALFLELLWRRASRGPRTPAELADMTLTTAALPFLATWHRAAGMLRHRGARPWCSPTTSGLRAVLFDRDGTLVHDVPYNGDPARVRPVAGAAAVVGRARAAGLAVGVVTNQSGIARGLLTREQVDAVDARVDALVGPFDTWQVCPHGPRDGCACRKPAPGMVKAAAEALGVPVESVAVVGDIGADVAAAEAAGAVGVLVPTSETRADEVRDARHTAPDLAAALDLLLAGVR
ncbi:HAD-IIIA family hydrolase [Aquipuribacter nitratireducens]|uniref:D,D-heptose 1,7-bisphosphate phosphatase n=1 Tax=Aquipuribacter nitratireducens TaxID=650104 RepID=A0ABW0GKH8_9MICO